MEQGLGKNFLSAQIFAPTSQIPAKGQQSERLLPFGPALHGNWGVSLCGAALQSVLEPAKCRTEADVPVRQGDWTQESGRISSRSNAALTGADAPRRRFGGSKAGPKPALLFISRRFQRHGRQVDRSTSRGCILTGCVQTVSGRSICASRRSAAVSTTCRA